MLLQLDKRYARAQIQNAKFIMREFGPPTEMLLVGGYAPFAAIHELKSSYVLGNYLAAILCAHVFMECTLGGYLILAGYDNVVDRGLAAITKETQRLGVLDSALAKRIDDLRRMRIAYFHPHVGLDDRGHMKRILRARKDPRFLLRDDARAAVQTIVDFLRQRNPAWNVRDRTHMISTW